MMRSAVERVMSSGWYVHGPEHQAFEQEFAAYCGTSECIGVASGTDALEIALRAVTAVRPGAVLTAANAGGYTTVAAKCAGLEVRYADIDASTLCVDPTDVARQLDGVAVVVVTHLYGRLGPVEELGELCRNADVQLIEDCAQAAGARRGGATAGSFGDVATFSFYPTKNLGAFGDGGAIVTSDEALARRVRMLRQYGWAAKYVIDIEGGRNSRLDEMQAAVLRVRLRSLDSDNERRRTIVSRYVKAATGTAVTVLAADGEHHVGHLAVAMTADREVVRHRFAQASVQTDVHYPLADHQQAAYHEQSDVSLPVTEAVTGRIFSLPCFAQLTDDEVDIVCDVLRSL